MKLRSPSVDCWATTHMHCAINPTARSQQPRIPESGRTCSSSAPPCLEFHPLASSCRPASITLSDGITLDTERPDISTILIFAGDDKVLLVRRDIVPRPIIGECHGPRRQVGRRENRGL